MMSIEKPGSEPKPPKNSGEESALNRRQFLKRLGLLAGGVAAGYWAGGQFQDWRDTEPDPTDADEHPEPAPDSDLDRPEPVPEPEEEEDMQSLREIIDFHTEADVELTPEVMQTLTRYWQSRYSDRENPELRDSLHQALEQMQPWLPYLQDIFRVQGVPEKYLYLAIPESHWQLEARSRAGAVGPYQFMPQTARDYNLQLDYYQDHPSNIDERQDPLKSAEACAKLLKDLYEAGGDWDLALSGYNGGFIWRYLSSTREQNEVISYAGFLKYISDRINEIKQEVKQSGVSYTVQSGDTLYAIAKQLDSTVDELCLINSIDDPTQIRVGQTIRTAQAKQDQEKEFWQRIRGFSENLNYPPKFNGIWEKLIELEVAGNNADQIQAPLEFETVPAGQGSIRYTFQPEDQTLYSLAQRFDIPPSELERANPHLDPTTLAGGEEITIPGQRLSLKQLADNYSHKLSVLEFLNPAVLNPDRPVPAGYEVRVPISSEWA